MYKFVANGETYDLKSTTVYGADGKLIIGDGEYEVDMPEGARIHLTVIPNEMVCVEEL